jgi:hypothetical protein
MCWGTIQFSGGENPFLLVNFRCFVGEKSHTVDGRNPAPVDRWFIPLFTGFQPSKVV